jgi:ABC-type sugar transport system ATPase subunit
MFGGFSLSELMMRMRKNHLLSESAELFLKSSLKQFTVSWDLIKDNPINNLKLSVTRICLILMLLHARYDILILDEPMFSLGHSQRMKVMEQLRDSMSRKHFVIISHSDYLVRSICDAALVIENGKLLLLQEDVIHA